MLGCRLELLLKSVYLLKGNKLYDGNKFTLPKGVVSGHDLIGWIKIIRINRERVSGLSKKDWDDSLKIVQEFLISYGRYPFSRCLDKDFKSSSPKDCLEDVGSAYDEIKYTCDAIEEHYYLKCLTRYDKRITGRGI